MALTEVTEDVEERRRFSPVPLVNSVRDSKARAAEKLDGFSAAPRLCVRRSVPRPSLLERALATGAAAPAGLVVARAGAVVVLAALQVRRRGQRAAARHHAHHARERGEGHQRGEAEGAPGVAE